ncbi:long chain acyl-CoA synthetase 7, peroxisomal isoform X2 [Citrus clementina]|uniref:long chain acyl-CoA synthetase 7, peroxisomal isoform X2 n=1 Tax=Citrus clementina TaxID=85681 RepID=UPI000CED33DC|nr:long chain acyl-CoA synthetase 7, peroxisomal isoform X2 [Citrus x clementina]
MEDSSAQRRFKAVQRHLTSTNTDRCSQLDYNHTTGCFVQSQGYSVRLPEKLQTGKWNVYRSARSPLTLVDRFPDHPEIGTLHDNFIYAVENYPDYKYLGTRVRVDGTVGGYKWMTYGEVSAARKEIGSGLLFHGLQKGVRIGLYLINRPEWLIVDHACSAYSYISVPLYDTLGPDAVKYVVNHAEIEAIFCIPQTLNTVVGGKDEHLPSLPSTSGVKLISYLQLQSQGCSSPQPFCPPKPEDIATICYTSGTTGTPKGVVLTHGNLISNVAGFSLMVQFYPSDIYMSYLPLAHIYERANQIVSVYYGVAVGFYQGDNLKLMDDLAVLKPTIFPSVPRLYNRIYSGITNAVKASGTLREKLFTAAYNSKKQAIVSGQTPSKMWDRLVFNKIRERLGGRVRFMGSGASPLSPDVMDFLKVCFGCQVMEGYGMTETSCIISAIDKGDNLSGHVGSPNPACEIKLVDVPEMNYTSEDQPHPRGEICVRGPIVFQGYYKNEVQTREVIDGDGWLHTGDIGLWLPGGRLKIIDRKKNIFKLAQGEYVAPEKIENVYAKCKFVLQCFIYGDSFNSCLVAIVAVDPDVLKDWAASQGIKFEDLEQLCNDLRARAAVLAEMNAVGEEGQLRGFEYAKAVTLMPEPFSVENGLLTPTFKIKRPQAKERFAKAISNMYAELATSDQIPQKTSNL